VEFSPLTKDVWTLSHACQGTLIMGETGSGKTSGSGSLIARKFLANGFGGLVLCCKDDEADEWRKMLKEAGREADGRFFNVDDHWRFNFLDYEGKTSAAKVFIENLVHLLLDVASVRKRSEPTGSEASYWLPQKKKLIRNAIELLKMAGLPTKLRSIYDLIRSSPEDARQLTDAQWLTESYLYQVLLQAEAQSGTD
jgi:hypothetical protein